MTQIGFLHTAEVHVATFEALAADAGVRALHALRPELLGQARADGASDAVRAGVEAAVADLVSRGADVVVCTCSTLGPVAEACTSTRAVLRVDRPMAAAAVAACLADSADPGRGGIGVVAALESTLAPTRELLLDEAARADVAAEIVEVSVPTAWDALEAGQTEEYHAQIAEAVRSLAGRVGVVVLAQASMAGAVDLVRDLGVPVFSSPALAVQAAAAWGTSGFRAR